MQRPRRLKRPSNLASRKRSRSGSRARRSQSLKNLRLGRNLSRRWSARRKSRSQLSPSDQLRKNPKRLLRSPWWRRLASAKHLLKRSLSHQRAPVQPPATARSNLIKSVTRRPVTKVMWSSTRSCTRNRTATQITFTLRLRTSASRPSPSSSSRTSTT